MTAEIETRDTIGQAECNNWIISHMSRWKITKTLPQKPGTKSVVPWNIEEIYMAALVTTQYELVPAPEFLGTRQISAVQEMW